MKKIDISKFSKIGTNPYKYFENYKLYFNYFHVGQEFEIKNMGIYNDDVLIFECESETTIRQNIDAWIWMGFFVKKDYKLIKIIENDFTEIQLIDYIKIVLLIDSRNSLINKHRNTVLIKLLSLNSNTSISPNYSYDEIIKETGKFEKTLFEDKKYMKLLENILGGNYE